jgi:hypothetical protein
MFPKFPEKARKLRAFLQIPFVFYLQLVKQLRGGLSVPGAPPPGAAPRPDENAMKSPMTPSLSSLAHSLYLLPK